MCKIKSQYQAILDTTTNLSLNKLLGVSFGESLRNQDQFHFLLHLSQNTWIIYAEMMGPNAVMSRG